VSLRVQPALFTSGGATEVDPTFRGAVRTALDASSWVELVPGWLSGADRLFDTLAERVPWRQLHRVLYGKRFREPRMTAEYRDIRQMPVPAIVAAADVLSAHYGVPYDGVWLNLYRQGRDSTSWHRDHFTCRIPDCIVPVLTLGTARRFLIKPKAGGDSIPFRPRSGDLLVMGGRAQEDWVHAVPKEAFVAGARISVNFYSSMQARRPPGQP